MPPHVWMVKKKRWKYDERTCEQSSISNASVCGPFDQVIVNVQLGCTAVDKRHRG